MAESKSQETQLEDKNTSDTDEYKIWIGNLDKNVTEFQLLQVVKRFGSIKDFKFLFHMNGPFKGEPRGYCFVLYETKENALKAIKHMNGKQLLTRKMIVDYAKKQNLHDEDGIAAKKETKHEKGPSEMSRQRKIQAIEEKLSLMEKGIETESRNSLGKYRTGKQLAGKNSHPYLHHRKRPTKR